jgi:hypothetical protein
VVGLRWTSHTRLVWTADPAATRYHIYRDDLPRLPSASPKCSDELDPNPTDTQLDDISLPPPAHAFYYLISGEAPNANEGPVGIPNAASCLL